MIIIMSRVAITKAFHNCKCCDLVEMLSEPDRSYWRVKGGDKILHELVITLPVAPVLLVRIHSAPFARILLHIHGLADFHYVFL